MILHRATESAEYPGVHPHTRCAALMRYGNCLREQGRLDEAEPVLRTAVASAEFPDVKPTDRCLAVATYGNCLQMQGRLVEAEPVLRRAAKAAEHSEVIRIKITQRAWELRHFLPGTNRRGWMAW